MAMSPELQRALDSSCALGVDEGLQAIHPEDLAALRALISPETDPAIRNNAVYLLGRLGDGPSTEPIRALLGSDDERERINAVSALGNLGTDEALNGVLDATRDSSPDVRRFAVYALGRLGSHAAHERLDELASSDPIEFVRAAARRTR
jgi:HEAT repeat protein